MVRRLALIVLVGYGACGKSEPATGPAGTVVALEGEAWAQRGEAERRVLAMNNEVWNDDVVTTADKATVKIRLRHNDVVWTLEGGQKKRVDASLAWNAPRGSTDPGLAGEAEGARTGSAGRHTEAEALGTAQTAVAPPAPREEVPPPAQATAPAPVPPPAQATAPPPPPPSPEPVRAAKPKKEAAPPKTRGGAPAPAAPADPLADLDAPRGGEAGGGGAAAKGKAPQAVVTLALDDAGGRDRGQVERVLRTFLPRIRRCFDQALQVDPGIQGSVRLTLGLRADGTVDTATADGIDSVRACVESAARGWRFPAGDKPVEIRSVYKLSH